MAHGPAPPAAVARGAGGHGLVPGEPELEEHGGGAQGDGEDDIEDDPGVELALLDALDLAGGREVAGELADAEHACAAASVGGGEDEHLLLQADGQGAEGEAGHGGGDVVALGDGGVVGRGGGGGGGGARRGRGEEGEANMPRLRARRARKPSRAPPSSMAAMAMGAVWRAILFWGRAHGMRLGVPKVGGSGEYSRTRVPYKTEIKRK
ncbi:unnamed protein product [Chondrus crispus]|uniref:Uncharacterized protein n=1 Tax=Chondrus crispus TaxID=2769 RepID=R7QGN0_CHOCR|nr:unnamed protein product [Chondrus crispus]CDF37244.1 unnamed protein product [Chondrus crispus]|eukprot:XP_005717063.1 unnamed protein product [Chondrus crispus]